MPKNKKAESSSSDSDEGPIKESEPPVSKKSKTDSGPANQKNAAKSDDNEPTWELGGTKRATVRVFRGKVYVDIREMYEKGGQLLPGKKGISLNPIQWRKLVSDSEEITKAITEAC